MIAHTPRGVWTGEAIDPGTAAVVVALARAGLYPSQVTYDFLNQVLRPAGEVADSARDALFDLPVERLDAVPLPEKSRDSVTGVVDSIVDDDVSLRVIDTLFPRLLVGGDLDLVLLCPEEQENT